MHDAMGVWGCPPPHINLCSSAYGKGVLNEFGRQNLLGEHTFIVHTWVYSLWTLDYTYSLQDKTSPQPAGLVSSSSKVADEQDRHQNWDIKTTGDEACPHTGESVPTLNAGQHHWSKSCNRATKFTWAIYTWHSSNNMHWNQYSCNSNTRSHG